MNYFSPVGRLQKQLMRYYTRFTCYNSVSPAYTILSWGQQVHRAHFAPMLFHYGWRILYDLGRS